MRLDADNEPQPDALLRKESDLEQPLAEAKKYIETAPELIVEVAASSVSYDLFDKKNVYQRNGVQEYVVWQLYENQLDWFLLQAGHYVHLTPDDDGILRSRVFPGLWLAVDDLLAGNLAQVLATVQQGVQTDQPQEERI